MLTETEKKYLESLSEDEANKLVIVKSFDPKTKEIAHQLIRKIKNALPNTDVISMGATA